jgi:hypothetical protein
MSEHIWEEIVQDHITALCETNRRAPHDRNVPARKSGRWLRAHDERPRAIPRRSNNVTLVFTM